MAKNAGVGLKGVNPLVACTELCPVTEKGKVTASDRRYTVKQN